MTPNDRKILHVDDDPQVTRLVGRLLARHGLETVPLNDPTRVLDQLVCQGYRVVLLDIDMPEVNGLDVLRRIKAHDGGTQVVILTGMSTVATVLGALRLGAEACFFKPINDIEPLAGALKDVIKKIDRWWATLHDLTRRRKDETAQVSA